MIDRPFTQAARGAAARHHYLALPFGVISGGLHGKNATTKFEKTLVIRTGMGLLKRQAGPASHSTFPAVAYSLINDTEQ